VTTPVYTPVQPDFLTRLWHRTPGWAGPAVLGCAMVGAAGYTQLSDPTHAGAGDLPSCLIKLTTGVDCPGCGGTRAFWFLMRGDLPAAAQHHLFFTFAAPFLLYAYVAWAGGKVFGWRLPMLRVSPKLVAIFLGAWLGFSVLRNLPWEPFTWFYV